ncbi:hypothetical protein [Salinibacter phage M8CC-19]|uniref:Uncharacterized protein n=2 Tax=Kryptosalinivirus M8CC19 TaxID=2560720 RepID=A0A2I6UGA6_9CAUD|nr:hypothetical protein FGG63_gp01 [Salinibacter phage M8CC-19]YP_009639425.1 hypothetical protein FGG63_gp76 [Salinibacter phage M8CC-19]AUO79260.1 hypothetical protein [Salinibacter phage M31CC-1]AUO79027.1 hypothetical protein [Salinibacter phage M8CC-19]AUO79028.1 hypothetical protein [Salinibacter phage M8CC-19]AUO79261.1 hypothetical protein [Salinibacter phage M31CC-1]
MLCPRPGDSVNSLSIPPMADHRIMNPMPTACEIRV